MDRYQRDGNILQAQPDLSALSHEPELQNLIAAMLNRCGAPSAAPAGTSRRTSDTRHAPQGTFYRC
jgi:hypothetical protein